MGFQSFPFPFSSHQENPIFRSLPRGKQQKATPECKLGFSYLYDFVRKETKNINKILLLEEKNHFSQEKRLKIH
jgi:hypothetical protein